MIVFLIENRIKFSSIMLFLLVLAFFWLTENVSSFPSDLIQM